MGEEVAISLKNVSKCYKRYAHPVERLKEILLPGKSRAQEFWALRSIDMDVFKGETLGIIGQNGSGKSTLLQIIAGTLTPTTGKVQVNGRISALLELGSGFNPEFSGRQNIFFSGQLLGLSQKEIENKFDSIAAFADIGSFLEQPVKTYSSGMFVRLAFAVAVSFNPDVLIVDEALAVGDIFFQQKCFERIRELQNLGTTLLFVSHDTSAVYNLCERAILIEGGTLVLQAETRQVVDLYEAKLLKKSDTHSKSLKVETSLEKAIPFISKGEESSPDNRRGEVEINVPEVKIQFINLLDEDEQPIDCVISDRFIQLSIGILFLEHFNDPHIGFKLRDRTGYVIFMTDTFHMIQHIGKVEPGTLLDVRFKFCVRLMEGEYTITVGVADSRNNPTEAFKRTLALVHNTAVVKVLRNKKAVLWSGLVNLEPSLDIQRFTIERDQVKAFLQMNPLPPIPVGSINLLIAKCPLDVTKDGDFSAYLEITNHSGFVLNSYEPNPVYITYHWMAEKAEDSIIYNGNRSKILPPLTSPAKGLYQAKIKAPNKAGKYVLRMTLVQEFVQWFDQEPTNLAEDISITVN